MSKTPGNMVRSGGIGYSYSGLVPSGEPGISSVTGTVSDGQTVTISGIGFGSRSATPIYFDDYRNATVGQTSLEAGLTNLGGNATHEPYVVNDRSLSGGKSLRMDYAPGFDSMFPRRGITGFDSKTLFVSSWGYYLRYTGTVSTFTTFKRIRAGANEYYGGNPKMRETIFPDWDTGIISGPSAFDRGVIDSNGGLVREEIGNENPNSDTWNRTDHYVDLGDAGVANGLYQNWVNQVKNDEAADRLIRYAGATANITWCISDFDGMDSYGADNGWYVWMDSFYIDTTKRRVELGNASVYSECTRSFIQPSQSWGDSQISATVVAGDLSGMNYLHVLDDNGESIGNSFGVNI